MRDTYTTSVGGIIRDSIKARTLFKGQSGTLEPRSLAGNCQLMAVCARNHVQNNDSE